MEDSVSDSDVEIAMIMATGASVDEATYLLDECGGNVDRAMERLASDTAPAGKSDPNKDELEFSPTLDHGGIPEEGTKLHKSIAKKTLSSSDEPHEVGDIEGDDTVITLEEEKEEVQEEVSPFPSGNNQENASTLERSTRTPRPPARTVVPGAFAVGGDGVDDILSQGDIESAAGTIEFIPEAEVVDAAEENRKRREQVEREVQLGLERERVERERNTAVAEVVTGFWCSPRAKRLAIVGLVLATIAIVLGLLLTADVLEPAPKSPLPDIVDLLSAVSYDNGQALLTTSTPQNKALLWVANNSNINEYTDKKIIQRYVLATLYFGTNGSMWDNNAGWLSDEDECRWYSDAEGPFCTDDGDVLEIDLFKNNLVGPIPPELALISEFVYDLDLDDNLLSGSLPTEIGLFANLTESVALDNNKLTGTLPSELGGLTNLAYMHLDRNGFTGVIPTEVGLLTSLIELRFHRNKLTGTIPTEVHLLTNLELLKLSENNLTVGDFICPTFLNASNCIL